MYHLLVFLAALALFVWFGRVFHEFVLRPWFWHRHFRKQGINGPPFRPIFGEIAELRQAAKSGSVLEMMSQRFERFPGQFDDVYVACLGPIYRLIIADPVAVQHILKNPEWYKPELMKRTMKPMLGMENLLLSEGNVHAQQRKLINPVFHFHNLKSMSSTMVNVVKNTLEKWENELKIDPKHIFEFHEQMSAITLDIVLTCVFGSALGNMDKAAFYKRLTHILDAVQQRNFNLINFLPWVRDFPLPSKRQANKRCQEIHAIIDQLIQDRKSGLSEPYEHGKTDLLELLLHAEDSGSARQKLSAEEIRSECVLFVLAGHETTSNLLTWCFERLTAHPDILSNAVAEVDSVLGDVLPTYESIQKCVYLEAILNETLRTRPSVPFIARTPAHEVQLPHSNGRTINVPVGVNVLLQLYKLGTHPKHWSTSDLFDPHHFIDPSTHEKKRIEPFTFLPFSSGPRSCIGSNFAMLEAKIALSMILQRFTVERVPGQRIRPQVSITLRAVPGFDVWLVPRLLK